nr:uncharacterized protein LOC119165656 isoform X2 [Rhipicephalus microplus]
MISKRKPLKLKYHKKVYSETVQKSKQGKKVLGLGCSIYNTCKSLIQKDTLRQSYDCILQPVRNEACAWDVVAAHPSNIEALDDAAALTRRVVLTFGWT